MMQMLRWMNAYVNIWRTLPAFLALKLNRFRRECEEDLAVWVQYFTVVKGCCPLTQLGFILVNHKETRNIFLNRLHRNPFMYLVIRIMFPPLDSLYINMPPEKIGGGFSVQHGFSTIIAAKEIGKNCRVFQQVTIGYNEEENPVIGDNVHITAGAIVIGGLHVGNNAVIGAGAVVVRDVPDGTTVAGVPARVIGSIAQNVHDKYESATE